MAADALARAASRLKSKGALAARYRGAGEALGGLDESFQSVDTTAHARFPGTLALGCKWIAGGLEILQADSEEVYREVAALRGFSPIADGLELMGTILRTGAASLGTLQLANSQKAPEGAEATASSLGERMNELASELKLTALAYHQIFGWNSQSVSRLQSTPEFIDSELRQFSEAYVAGTNPVALLAKLLVAKAEFFTRQLSGLFLSIAQFLPLTVVAYIPWHCSQECVGDGRLVGVSLSRTAARRLSRVDPFFAQGGTPGILFGFLLGAFVAHQPQIYISWDFCCYNFCVLFWNDQFIKTVETGPHDIGEPVSGVMDDAHSAAERRATTEAMLRFPRPPVPC